MAKATKKTKTTAKAAEPQQAEVKRTPRVLNGLVVSNKMDKTAVIKVDRQVSHPVYKKYLMRSKKYKIHDEENKLEVGDYVSVVETRALSRHKRFTLKEVLRSSRTANLNIENVDVMADVSGDSLAREEASSPAAE